MKRSEALMLDCLMEWQAAMIPYSIKLERWLLSNEGTLQFTQEAVERLDGIVISLQQNWLHCGLKIEDAKPIKQFGDIVRKAYKTGDKTALPDVEEVHAIYQTASLLVAELINKIKRPIVQCVQAGTQQVKPADNTKGNIQATLEVAKMKVVSTRNLVFISYSHKDKRWLENLQTHLKPYLRNGSTMAWSDKQIASGSKWFEEIKAALASSKIAVMLVTPNFLASDFIHEHEFLPLLKKAKKGGVRIIWIPIRACAFKTTALKDYQAVCDPQKPLAKMKAERDEVWVKICEEIRNAVVDTTEE